MADSAQVDIPDSLEIWRRVPPEEKLELMAKAQATGVLSAFICIVVLSTVAVGLHFKWLLWSSIVLAPFVFQFASAKRWRNIKPVVMLEYLAARSAARRFAYAAQSKDMRLELIFKGILIAIFDQEHRSDELEAEFSDHKQVDVWVALFPDCVVMMSERPGGAELEFAALLNEKLRVEGKSPDGDSPYSSERELIFRYQGKNKEEKQTKLISRYPAALVVFEKKLSEFQKAYADANKVTPMQATSKDIFSFSSGDEA